MSYRTLKINKNNIIGIIHIIDTDATYLGELYAHDNGEHDFRYEEDGIHADSKERIMKRNQNKASAMDKLANTNTILGLPYKAYYMSCNLDHVISNTRNESDEQGVKTDAALDFSDKYENDLDGFVQFINAADLIFQGDYKETWRQIREGRNSIDRHSNLHLFVNDPFGQIGR